MTPEPTTPDSARDPRTASIDSPNSTQQTVSSPATPTGGESTPPPPPPLARAAMNIPRGEPLRAPKPEGQEEKAKDQAVDAPAPQSTEEPAEKEDEQDMEELFHAAVEEMEEGTGFTAGEIREVSVVAITGESVFVDVGDKAEGVISLAEFTDADGKPCIEVGQTIPVELRGYDSESGQVRVSHRSAIARLSLARIEEAHEKGIPLTGRVTSVVKGGLVVDIGLQAFMPASQTDLHRVDDLSQFVGQNVDVLVIEFNRQRKRAVVSRRRRLEDERKEAKRGLLEGLQPGQVMDGIVKNIQEFGVFVDLGGIDGFIPREEISYDRGAAPDQFFHVGDETKVKVVKVDPATERITLSRKQTGTDPWVDADSRLPVGARVRGKVVSLTHYGAFVQIEEGITGMIHASDMSWSTKANLKPSEFVNEGDIVEAQVLEINTDKRRLSLGLKQITMDPWIEVEAKYPVGSRVKGAVTSMTNYGAFVRLDENIEGMIHVSDLSWEKRISHPNKMLKQGQEVECVVLKADPLQRRLSLGIKQLEESPFESFQRAFPIGSIVTGEVTRVVPFGAFVKLPGDIEGLLHVSQIDEQRIENPEHVLKVGEKVTCKITKVDIRSQKISLSRKEALKQLDREFMKQYQNREVSGGMNFGEALRLATGGQNLPETPAPKPHKATPPRTAAEVKEKTEKATAEEAKVEDGKAEAEAPEPKAETPKVDEPKAEAKVDEPTAETVAPIAETSPAAPPPSPAEEPKVAKGRDEAPNSEAARADEPVAEAPEATEAEAETPKLEEPKAAESAMPPTEVEHPMQPEAKVEETGETQKHPATGPAVAEKPAEPDPVPSSEPPRDLSGADTVAEDVQDEPVGNKFKLPPLPSILSFNGEMPMLQEKAEEKEESPKE